VRRRTRPDLLLALGRFALAAPVPVSAAGAAAGRKQAQADLDAAAAARPNDEETRYWAGIAFAGGSTPEEHAKAVEHLKAAIQAAPRKARAGFALGRLLYEKQGRMGKALEIYRQALKLEPQSVEVEEGLARVTAALKLPEALYHQARVREMTERSDAPRRPPFSSADGESGSRSGGTACCASPSAGWICSRTGKRRRRWKQA
jgi:tetratricopeptide (TPR) repeat protein